MKGTPTNVEHATNKDYVDRMLGYYSSSGSEFVSTLINMGYYDSRHAYELHDCSVKSVPTLGKARGRGHTWDKQYPFVKHVDSDGINCIMTRVSGSRGSCMLFVCPEVKVLPCSHAFG